MDKIATQDSLVEEDRCLRGMLVHTTALLLGLLRVLIPLPILFLVLFIVVIWLAREWRKLLAGVGLDSVPAPLLMGFLV